jgi:uncharacterized membrane protein
MKLTKKDFAPILLIAIVLIIGIYLLPQLPNKVPSHWNIEGKIDGWMNKNVAVYFFPALIFFIYALLVVAPLLDPLKKNYDEFIKQYYWFKLGFTIFLLSIYIFTLLVGMGYDLNINYFLLPLLSLGMILTGLFIPTVKRNFFVGYRTPWALHSDNNWDQTHKFAGNILIWTGFISLISLGFLKSNNAVLLFIICLFTSGVAPLIKSYLIFSREKNEISDNKEI